MLEAGLFSSVAPLTGGVIEEDSMKVRTKHRVDPFDAYKFEGNMFSAVDIIREVCPHRLEDCSFSPQGGLLAIYDPVADRAVELTYGDWLVRAPGGMLYSIPDDVFQFVFKPAD
jgi:hypothetical protein